LKLIKRYLLVGTICSTIKEIPEFNKENWKFDNNNKKVIEMKEKLKNFKNNIYPGK